MRVKNRADIPAQYKWRTEQIFPSDEAWEESYFAVGESIGKISAYNGRLKDDGTIKECLDLDTRLGHDVVKLYHYAHLRHDEDTRVALYQGMKSRAEQLYVRYSTLTSFVTPELSELSVDELKRLADDKRFADYSVYLGEIIRQKDVILSKKEEKILREAGIFAGASDDVFNMFDNADVKFRPVPDGKGGTIEMSHGVYSQLLQNPDREIRRAAFESMFEAYRDHINMLAANYAGNVNKDWFFAKVRGFSSSLDRAMFAENVPPTCYAKLLATVGKGTRTLHAYIALRRRLLGGELNMYDLHVPLVGAVKSNVKYEKAVETVKSALKVMGREYSDILAKAFEDGWIDVYENKGKRSGAYSSHFYGEHPYVLLNHTGTTHDTFTIAHELGHALHSYYSAAAQPEQKADYEIFVAEIASTVNEVLLLKYLLGKSDGEMRKYLLSYYLDMFRTTIFRQTMFAEFEAEAHAMAERGDPLTADALSTVYYALNKKYYGRAVRHNDLIRYEWARIPHFFTAFYVYKYATGLTAAVTIADNILKGGEEYFAKYRAFLSAGGSLPPLDILRLADVDLETDAPYERAMKEFADTLAEFEKCTVGAE